VLPDFAAISEINILMRSLRIALAFQYETPVLPADLPHASMRPRYHPGWRTESKRRQSMLSQAKTNKKTIIVIATLMLIAAGSIIWSRSGSTEHQETAKKAKAAEASITISPLEITLERGKNLPVGSWGDPF
jgi:hypothetical protein